MKILCLADGFGDSTVCPDWYPDYYKWPRILGLMLKGVRIIEFCRYGAGNEYLMWCLRQNYQSADIALVQWAMPDRLDLLLHHRPKVQQAWRTKIASDPIYSNNLINVGDHQWWLSSASTVDWVDHYHSNLISLSQHQLRSRMFVEYAHQLLADQPHGFMLTADSDYLQDVSVPPDVWIWHQPWKGMYEWRYDSIYRHLDLGMVQPIPLIHFEFIKRFIMPKFDLPWRKDIEINAVESMLLRKFNDSIQNRPQ